MSIIKQIDYIDGGYHYNTAEVLEVKDYVTAHLTEVVDDVVVRDGGEVWFPVDNMPFELTEEDIDEINNPKTEVEDEEIQ